VLASGLILVTVPDERKAQAVSDMVHRDRDPAYPATCLKQHADVHVYLDGPAASKLERA